MAFRNDSWGDFGPIKTMIRAGLSPDAASALVSEFAHTSTWKQRSILQKAVHSAATISDLVIKTANKVSITLDPDAVTAFCQIVSDYDDPDIRRLLATQTGKHKWHKGIPLLSYLLWDDDASVKKSAALSIGKLDLPLLRAIKASAKGALASSPEDLSLDGSIEEVVPGTAEIELGADDVSGIAHQTQETSVQEKAETASTATVRRFTQVDYTADREKPRCGEIALTLKLKPNDAMAKALDVRVRRGKDTASLVVHASSVEFKVTPEVRKIAVPRKSDSEASRFAVCADGTASGSVCLTSSTRSALSAAFALTWKQLSKMAW